jgi:hypothetical protein
MSKALGAAGIDLRLAGIVTVLAALAGCGGGKTAAGLGSAPQQAAVWPVHNYAGAARSGSFAVVAVDSSERNIDPLTSQLSLQVKPEAGGTLVSIHAADVSGLNTAYLHLKYDNTQMHPVLTRSGEWVPQDTVFLGITSVPGLVTLGLASTGSQPLLRGTAELAAVRFEPGPYLPARRVSAVSNTPVTDLHFSATTTKQLVWSYISSGDYDQNSEVGIADITPIGIYFHKNSTSANWAAAQCADGDGNGEVNIADLQPIGANYRKTISGYQVKGGTSESGPFSDDALVNFDPEAFPVPGGGGRRQFTYTVNTAVDGAWYAVVPVDGAEESGALSNVVQFHGASTLPAPQNLTAANGGPAVHLSWQAPSGATPDGYNAYVAAGQNMTGAQIMNLGPISGLGFDCPLSIQTSGSYYFAVRAVYGSSESANSNIFGYNVSTFNSPSGLAAVKQDSAVVLNWTVPNGSTPDGYYCYVGAASDLSDAQRMNLPPIVGTSYTCPLVVDPAQEHYFGVKALYGGSESGYSNICHYTPDGGGGGGDTTPPVWQQGDGIKAATPTPDGTSIIVSWHVAVDADTPPVQYLLYVVPDGQQIDWNVPADVFASTITSTPVTTLGDGTPLQMGQRYVFAVRAQDNCNPPNVTTNTNTVLATPQILPTSPTAVPPDHPLAASDTATVRVQGEEVPRMAAVNHSSNLYYVKWDTSLNPPNWTVYDLNTTIGVTGRKYHPQLVAIGDEVHLLFATQDSVYEAYGPKDSPETWQLKVIQSGYSSNPGVTGSALVYSAQGNYLACCYGAKQSSEQVWYSDRDLTGDWSTPVSIMTGNPQIWQCDMAISEQSGAQWIVAASGSADSNGDNLKFWYATRASRSDAWGAGTNSTLGGDVMTVEIDPATDKPLVADAQVREVDLGIGQNQPVTDASILTWTGNAWAANVLEQGDCVFDSGSGTLDTILTGQDPQIVFSPGGQAVALWSKLDFFADIIQDDATLTGDWRYSQRPSTTWSPPSSLLSHISSSNSVTAGDSFKHCVTCDLGLQDEDTYEALGNKYSKRNDFVEGQLYYVYQAWN